MTTKEFIALAKNNKINVYDTVLEKVISREAISNDGFYSHIFTLPNKNEILISGDTTENYILYNLDKMEVTKKQESYVNISNIIILNKEENL